MINHQLSLYLYALSGRRISWNVLILDPNDSREFDWPAVVYDPLKSADFPYCVNEGRVLWGVPNARREFLEALRWHQEQQTQGNFSANRAGWLAIDVLRLGGLAGIW